MSDSPKLTPADSDALEREGLRDRSKREKWHRIRLVARQLFVEKGYEATTTREIARRAEVGTGTLFLYVQDKADLLAALFEEDMGAVLENAYKTLPSEAPLLDRIMHLFEAILGYYDQNPDLGRVIAKQLPFLERAGAARSAALNFEFFGQLRQLVDEAQARGEIRSDRDLSLAPYNFFAAYFMSLLAYFNGRVANFREAASSLRALIQLQCDGLSVRSDPTSV